MFRRCTERLRLSTIFNRCAQHKTDAHKDSAEEKEIHQWDRPLEFLFSLISNSVGLGNVWRFPYLAAQSGGGAFLIPYFILYFLIGAPLYYLELALGQFSSRGPATGFILARGWQGVGIAMVINSYLGMLYYNVIIAWALFYFVLSFRKELLWSRCGHWWNTDRCFVPGADENTFTSNGTTWNCTEAQFKNVSDYTCAVLNTTGRVTAAEEFYFRLVLNKSQSFDDFGVPGGYMSAALLLAWIIVCAAIIRGVQSSGKVAYVTAILPYIVLLVLIIFSATLEGSADGIKFYIIPRWELLSDFKIWQAAASQVFFSLGLSIGSLMAYSSANKFKNKFFRQMCIVVSCDCFTGVFAGFAVFATIGFLARSLKEPVENYAKASGPGLAFITYPQALSQMPASSFFSIIFFLMLLALGLGTQFASTDVPVTVVMEYFPSLKHRRGWIVIVICVVSYLISLPFTCPGGIYLFDLFQEYSANISLVLIGFFEVVTVAYIYGFNRFMNDVKMMLNYRAAEYYLFVTWRITAPLLTLVITVLNLVNTTTLTNEPSAGFPRYVFPTWSVALGWIIFLIGMLPIPLFYIFSYIQEYRRLPTSTRLLEESDLNYAVKPRYLVAFTRNNSPREDWGPKRAADQWGDYAHLSQTVKQRNQDRETGSSYLDPVVRNNAGSFINPVYSREASMTESNQSGHYF